MQVLVIGYGNAGRGDDGLGPALAARLEKACLPGCCIEIDYQLGVEHAWQVAHADCVVFVDAMIDNSEPFRFLQVSADLTADLGSHSLSPEAVLALAGMLYTHAPDAFVLGISGAEFGEVAEGLSDTAAHNLDLAEAFFLDWLATERAPLAPRTHDAAQVRHA